MYLKMQQNLVQKHEADKEGKTSVYWCCAVGIHNLTLSLARWAGALEAQRVKYEEQLAKLKERLESNTSTPMPPPPKIKVTT